MSEGVDEFGLDPWGWLHDLDEAQEADLSGFRVTAVMVPADGDPSRCAAALNEQSVDVASITTRLDPDQPGDWLWIVPDDTVPEPDALERLLIRVLAERDTSVVGCLLIEPRRRGAGKLVSDWAQTISGNGRMHLLTDPGELYQGQLTPIRALGVPAAGMLVRGDVWRFLGGFNTDLPRSHWGLDFGWRANLTGYRVMADPEAQLTNYAPFSDPALDRAAGLALTVANTKRLWRWAVGLRLIVATLIVAVGYLLGKDLTRAGEEFGGLWQWLRNRRMRRDLNRELASLPVKPGTAATTRALRPALGSGVRRAAALTATRFGAWLETFSGRGDSVSFDEMTGDDFAEVGDSRQQIPLAATVGAVLAIGALLASRNSYEAGLLSAAQLLPAPETSAALIDSYFQPVAGGASTGTPWAAIVGIVSLITFGHPDWLVTILLCLAVPLSWLLAFRVFRLVVSERYLAGIAALAYALIPAIIGGLNVGSLGVAAISILLPVLAYSARHWLVVTEWSWRAAGAVSFWLLLVVALVPAFWLVALAGAIVLALRAGRPHIWLQVSLVVAAPLITLIGPWGGLMLRYPGRLLTGIEPSLAPITAVAPWLLVLGHPLDAGAPAWIGIGLFAVLWLAALVGAWRRPAQALPGLAVAAAAMIVAVVITRLVVEVPPGTWARPEALEWVVLAAGGLLVAGARGLEGVTTELAGKNLGVRHLGLLGLALATAAALLTGLGWWVLAGQLGLTRGPAETVPTFVADAQVSSTPGRTLTMSADADQVGWALSEHHFSRLGDAERGLAFGGSADARSLAASVVTRLVGESADEQIVPDLVRLGVSYVTLSGGEASQRISINNTPGLGLGTGTDAQFVWPVPNSAIAVVDDGQNRVITGNGEPIAPGAAERVLQLAVPNDPGWVVELDGQRLEPVANDGPGMSFRLGAAGGTLRYHLVAANPWWAWIQLAGLAALALLAAPSVRRRPPTQPRRIVGGEL
ncbi:MAG: hypothetical protein LWW77_07065 [Propionibacteriales bacterium]|nr:hypothetical protein [Propionibacteriales bacterium]